MDILTDEQKQILEVIKAWEDDSSGGVLPFEYVPLAMEISNYYSKQIEKIFNDIEIFAESQGHFNVSPPGKFWKDLKAKYGVKN